ncbi:hypothetical protein EVAR_83611_1 [Eumeta japonica]|uniref:Uncharacterized protein n=1 Tax=Eumeta variegata TaxID=151549 RepID=A0A4C1UP32_EUMVA|nr:hypothetical protein EVAR_83611_1 [Eumeta japonica]
MRPQETEARVWRQLDGATPRHAKHSSLFGGPADECRSRQRGGGGGGGGGRALIRQNHFNSGGSENRHTRILSVNLRNKASERFKEEAAAAAAGRARLGRGRRGHGRAGAALAAARLASSTSRYIDSFRASIRITVTCPLRI